MLMHKLTGLNLAKKLLRITSHVSGGYLVAYDLSLGIDDECSALGKTVSGDQHVEILGNTVGRIRQHGIIDLLNAVRRIVPRLVDKMRIRGDGIHFTTDGLELIVLILLAVSSL